MELFPSFPAFANVFLIVFQLFQGATNIICQENNKKELKLTVSQGVYQSIYNLGIQEHYKDVCACEA